jgi:hypothetical protein
VSPVADEELGGYRFVGELTGDVPGLLGDPCCIGVSGHPGDPDPPAAELDEEQHVEAFEQDGVDVEEIGGHNTRSLGTQERTPSGATAPGSRAEAVVLQNLGDSARRQAHAEFAEFTLDAAVAPPRIILRQADHQGGGLVVDGRSTWWTMGVRPPSGDQPVVPGQQGCRRDAEGSPR